MKRNFKNAVNDDILKNPKLTVWLKWPVIIILTILFWPLGICLIWKRINIDKKTAMLSGKYINVSGWIFLSLALLGLLACSSEGFKSDDVEMITFFTMAGIAFILLGNNTKKKAKEFKKYISIVINQEITSIDDIAFAIPTTYDNAKKQLGKMIDNGYFEGAYIDEYKREIVVAKKQELLYNETASAGDQKSMEMIVVTCNGCGANNKLVKGSVGECK